ncbi:MAG: hypothetical protein GEU99_08860 [Luteitalea sp.]|nr:hypothetical protein [Luteitalea sp.]
MGVASTAVAQAIAGQDAGVQDGSTWEGLPDGASEWSVFAAGGRTAIGRDIDGVARSGPDARLALSAFQWSRVLTAPHGFTPIRGQLQMGFELVPVLHAVESREALGFGVSPLVLRWRFVGTRHVQPYIEALTGVARTDHQIPDGTTRLNFLSQAGVGTWLALSDGVGVLIGYRFEHLSNASRRPFNPGLDFHVVYLGMSWIRPPR